MATGSSIAPQRADLADLAPAELEALYSRLATLREDLAELLPDTVIARLCTGLDRALVRIYAAICGASAHHHPNCYAGLPGRAPESCACGATRAIDAFDHDRSAGFPVAIAETELRALWGDR
jgi:hypothetical protein